MLLQHLDGGGEPGAGGRFRFAEWSVVRLGCGGVRVKNDFVFTNLDLIDKSFWPVGIDLIPPGTLISMGNNKMTSSQCINNGPMSD